MIEYQPTAENPPLDGSRLIIQVRMHPDHLSRIGLMMWDAVTAAEYRGIMERDLKEAFPGYYVTVQKKLDKVGGTLTFAVPPKIKEKFLEKVSEIESRYLESIGPNEENENPPLTAAEDVKNRRLVGFLMRLPKVKAAEAGRMGTGEFFYEVEYTDGKVFRHRYATQEELIAGVGMFVRGIERDNPPLEILSDQMGASSRIIHYRITVPMNNAKDAEKIIHTLYPQWRVVSHYSLKPGSYPGVTHAYGVQMKIRHDRKNFPQEMSWWDKYKALMTGKHDEKNPPLPASALMDISTAKIVAHEVEEGQRPLGNLATADHLSTVGCRNFAVRILDKWTGRTRRPTLPARANMTTFVAGCGRRNESWRKSSPLIVTCADSSWYGVGRRRSNS